MNRILAVDDSPTIRMLIGLTLTKSGFEVIDAPDGEVALALCAQRAFDCVIADLCMPKIDGVSLVRALRADPRHRHVPILMLTANSGGERKEESRRAGANGWLVKPFGPDELVAVVRLELQRSAAARAA